MSDRGSNFVKALKNFFVIWCFAHRLNNVLKLCFFTAATKEDKRKAMDNMQLSDDSDEDFDSVIKSECVQDLPKKALYVLKVVFECKALVKYVKKVSLSLYFRVESIILSTFRPVSIRTLKMRMV